MSMYKKGDLIVPSAALIDWFNEDDSFLLGTVRHFQVAEVVKMNSAYNVSFIVVLPRTFCGLCALPHQLPSMNVRE